jgi:hypothetical protein
MGKVGKGIKCNVVGCNAPAARSISHEKASAARLEIAKGRRAYLCITHYKEMKKKLRVERRLEKWRLSG